MAKRSRAVAFLSALLLLLTGQGALAAGGQVTHSLGLTSPIGCTGVTTVTLSLAGQSPPPGQKQVDVMLVLDRSGSMTSGNAIGALKNAAGSFINTMDSSDGSLNGNIAISRVGSVSFADTATLDAALTHDATFVKNHISAMNAFGGTNISHGIDVGQSQLAASAVKRVMILMTDGVPNRTNRGGNPSTDAIAAATAAKNAGTEIYTIGLGSGINVNLLKTIATDVNHYYQAPTAAQLEQIFQQIAQGVAGPAATNLAYTVEAGPDFSLTSVSAPKGTVSPSANGFMWTLSELRTENLTITYTLAHTGATGGTKPVHAKASLVWADDDGDIQSASYTGAMVPVEGCNQPPTANAGPDQAVPMTGPAGAMVTLDGSGSTDDGQIQPLTYTWTEGANLLGTGATLNHTFPLGGHTVTLTVFDGQFSATDEVSITVEDRIPPVTTITVSGTMGNNGWYVSSVDVTVSASDNPGGSGVASTDVTLDGAPAGLAFTVGTDGLHAAAAHSTDYAGNVESPGASAAFKIDMTPPVLDISSPESRDYDVSESVCTIWSASDSGSGIAASTGALDGAPVSSGDCDDAFTLAPGDHSFTATATDNAGNTVSQPVHFRVVVTHGGLELVKHKFQEMGWIDNHGIVNSLDQKLRAAQAAHERGQHDSENKILDAFIAEVEAQRQKHVVTDTAANYLVMFAQYLQTHH